MKTLRELQDEIGEWADATFPKSNRDTILSHFSEEVVEFQHACNPIFPDYPNAGEEFVEAADCVILLLHFAHRVGFDLQEAIEAKMAVNRSREWNTTPESGGHFKHVKSGGAA